jgi:GNAT superfamily N-acetyltransferase
MIKLQIVEYTPKYASAFRVLNEAWIKKFFEIEDEDIKALSDPGKIIDNGGYIFIALSEGKEVGVCALRKVSSEVFELSKLAVAETNQGQGIGRKLIEKAIEVAKIVEAKRIYLEGNTKLEASIRLYNKMGFKEFDGESSTYKRVNIMMEMHL